MVHVLTVEELKRRAVDFVTLLGNDHDTTSDQIINLLDSNFAVQHGESLPSSGGHDAFLENLGSRLRMAHGQVSVEVRRVIAEAPDDAGQGGQCWVYSRKNTPLGCTDSLDMITFTPQGKIILCQDLHSPKTETWSRFWHWLLVLLRSR